MAAGVTKSAKILKSDKATAAVWAAALSYALETLYQYTAARKPSRTLIDPLDAFTTTFAASNGADFRDAVKEAIKASAETKDLIATAGRAAYLGRDDLQKAQVPDPGAHGIAKLLEGFRSVLV